MERMKIIRKVGDKAVDWCHPLVVVLKPSRKVRICVDLKKLNDQVKRPIHTMRAPWDIISCIPTNIEFFTTLDAKQGYCQMELEENPRDMTCFMTPWSVRKILRRYRENKITLNPSKFVFVQPKLKYCGYIFSKKSIEVDPSKLDSTKDFVEPSSRKKLRSFLGLVNHLGQFSPRISEVVGPLRELLS
nr:uncharacterized protein LOC121132217 [Lepeophtheirus salmonis]